MERVRVEEAVLYRCLQGRGGSCRIRVDVNEIFVGRTGLEARATMGVF